MTVLWGARRRDTQVGSPADLQRQATLLFLRTHGHLERAPATVGHALGMAAGHTLRRLARRIEGA